MFVNWGLFFPKHHPRGTDRFYEGGNTTPSPPPHFSAPQSDTYGYFRSLPHTANS